MLCGCRCCLPAWRWSRRRRRWRWRWRWWWWRWRRRSTSGGCEFNKIHTQAERGRESVRERERVRQAECKSETGGHVDKGNHDNSQYKRSWTASALPCPRQHALSTLNVQQLFSIIANQMLHSIDVYMQRESEREREEERATWLWATFVWVELIWLACLQGSSLETGRWAGINLRTRP